MNLKTVEIDGKTYAEVQDGKPVYVDNGAEVPFDIGGVTALRGEAMRHRQDKEKAENALKAFDGIEDPAAARVALETVAKIDQKTLIDAGEVDRVRNEVGKGWETKLTAAETRAKALEEQLYGEKIGGAFARSKLIADQFAIPADMVQARFGSQFKVEDGQTVAYDAAGNRIYSKANPSALAGFDEALEAIVQGYAYRDNILKGSNPIGSGATGNPGAPTANKTIGRAQFDALPQADRAAKIKDGFTLTD